MCRPAGGDVGAFFAFPTKKRLGPHCANLFTIGDQGGQTTLMGRQSRVLFCVGTSRRSTVTIGAAHLSCTYRKIGRTHQKCAAFGNFLVRTVETRGQLPKEKRGKEKEEGEEKKGKEEEGAF